MRWLFVGNFCVGRSSGYAIIQEALCTELAQRGHEITVLGHNWGREEHNYPFQVIPSDFTWVPMQVLRVHQALRFDHCVLAMDIPKIEQLSLELSRQGIKGWPEISGLFPIESGPVASTWLRVLAALKNRFVISRFGQGELAKNDLSSTFVPMTSELPTEKVDREKARRELKAYVQTGKKSLLDQDVTMVLTVADNQERKALPVIAEALQHLDESIVWLLVTAPLSPHGWHLPEIFDRYGLNDRVLILQDLPRPVMSLVYFAADLFVLASQAEGACLPLYEAMAHGLLCVGPRHTAVTEAINGRGVLVEPAWQVVSPWGCVDRFHLDPRELAEKITEALTFDFNPERGEEFIRGRSWKSTADIVEEALCPSKEAVEPVRKRNRKRTKHSTL